MQPLIRKSLCNYVIGPYQGRIANTLDVLKRTHPYGPGSKPWGMLAEAQLFGQTPYQPQAPHPHPPPVTTALEPKHYNPWIPGSTPNRLLITNTN